MMMLDDKLLLAVVAGVREQMKRLVRERRAKGEHAAFLMTSPDSAVLVLAEGSVAFRREGRGFLPTPPLADVTDFGGVPIDEGPPKLTLEGPLRALLAVVGPHERTPANDDDGAQQALLRARNDDDEAHLAAVVKLELAACVPLALRSLCWSI